MLDRRLQIERVRPHEDLQHPKRWLTGERVLLMPEAAARIHDHEVVRLGDELAGRAVIAPHDTLGHIGDDLVLHVLVHRDPSVGSHKRIGDQREWFITMVRMAGDVKLRHGRENDELALVDHHGCSLGFVEYGFPSEPQAASEVTNRWSICSCTEFIDCSTAAGPMLVPSARTMATSVMPVKPRTPRR